MHGLGEDVSALDPAPVGASSLSLADLLNLKGRSPDADGVASSIAAGPVHPGSVRASGASVAALVAACTIGKSIRWPVYNRSKRREGEPPSSAIPAVSVLVLGALQSATPASMY